MGAVIAAIGAVGGAFIGGQIARDAAMDAVAAAANASARARAEDAVAGYLMRSDALVTSLAYLADLADQGARPDYRSQLTALRSRIQDQFQAAADALITVELLAPAELADPVNEFHDELAGYLRTQNNMMDIPAFFEVPEHIDFGASARQWSRELAAKHRILAADAREFLANGLRSRVSDD